MAQKSLAMTFLFGPPYDIITWAGHLWYNKFISKNLSFRKYKYV